MIQIDCAAACGNLDLCLIACPHNAQLDQMLAPVCAASSEGLVGDDAELMIVVEEQGKHERYN